MRMQLAPLPFIMPRMPSVRAMCTRPCTENAHLHVLNHSRRVTAGYRSMITAQPCNSACLPDTAIHALVALDLHQDLEPLQWSNCRPGTARHGQWRCYDVVSRGALHSTGYFQARQRRTGHRRSRQLPNSWLWRPMLARWPAAADYAALRLPLPLRCSSMAASLSMLPQAQQRPLVPPLLQPQRL
jgi:hypothetical protein